MMIHIISYDTDHFIYKESANFLRDIVLFYYYNKSIEGDAKIEFSQISSFISFQKKLTTQPRVT